MTGKEDMARLADPGSGASQALRSVLEGALDPADAGRLARVEQRLGVLFVGGVATAIGAAGAGGTSAATGTAGTAAAGTAGTAAAAAGASKLGVWVVIAGVAVTAGTGITAWQLGQSEARPEAPHRATAASPAQGTDRGTTPTAADPSTSAAPAVDLRFELADVPETQPPARREQADSLHAEVGLLGQAQRLVETDPARSLELISEHERRFRRGALVEEREVYAVEALVKLGQREAAERRATRFLAARPDSPHAARVRNAIGP